MNTKQLKKHRKGCLGLANVKSGNWPSPWAFLGDSETRDSIGRKVKYGWRRWYRVRCNDPDCPAVIMVQEESILVGLPAGDSV